MKKPSKQAADEYIYIRLPKEIKQKIKKAAKEDYCNLTVWVRKVLIERIEK